MRRTFALEAALAAFIVVATPSMSIDAAPTQQPEAMPDAGTAPDAKAPTVAKAPDAKAATPSTSEKIEILPENALPLYKDLLNEKSKLAVERAALDEAKADLARAEKEVEARVASRIAELERLIQKQEALKEEIRKERAHVLGERVERLVQITQKMPPGNAASYLSGLNEDEAASILAGMSARSAAKVMAALTPAKAAALSRLYLNSDSSKPNQPSAP